MTRARRRVLVAAIAAVAAVAAAVAVAAAASPAHRSRDGWVLLKRQRSFPTTPCVWSYYADPRVVVHGDGVFIGCITPRGAVTVARLDLRTGRRRLSTMARGLETDDHNNPGLVFFRRRLYVFWSPHSGYHYPLNRHFYVRYRVSRRAWGAGGFGPVHQVPLPRECGLGYTYPNPVVSRGRLYLFLRGPCWYPYFTTTANGLRWTAPKTLLLGPPRAGRQNRPYAKYSDAPDGSIHMAFSDGNVAEYPNSLYYVRYRAGRFYRANGRLIGRLRDLPLRLGQLDHVYRFKRRIGSALPRDVASLRGRPFIVYSTSVRRDEFRYARWGGRQWGLRRIAPAGRGASIYQNAGASLDHADPSIIVLARAVGRSNEVQVLRTPNRGRSWRLLAVVRRSRGTLLRPVFARGSAATRSLVVVYITGSYRSFRSYTTVAVMRLVRRPG